MSRRTLAVSEVRRLLPEIVRTIAEEGGRVDVTVRGQPQVSIVRTADLALRSRRAIAGATRLPTALRVELGGAADRLVHVIRELRSRVGIPRPLARRSSAQARRRRR